MLKLLTREGESSYLWRFKEKIELQGKRVKLYSNSSGKTRNINIICILVIKIKAIWKPNDWPKVETKNIYWLEQSLALCPIKANISLVFIPWSYGYLIPVNAIFLITNETLLVHSISVYNHYIKSFSLMLSPCNHVWAITAFLFSLCLIS